MSIFIFYQQSISLPKSITDRYDIMYSRYLKMKYIYMLHCDYVREIIFKISDKIVVRLLLSWVNMFVSSNEGAAVVCSLLAVEVLLLTNQITHLLCTITPPTWYIPHINPNPHLSSLLRLYCDFRLIDLFITFSHVTWLETDIDSCTTTCDFTSFQN